MSDFNPGKAVEGTSGVGKQTLSHKMQILNSAVTRSQKTGAKTPNPSAFRGNHQESTPSGPKKGQAKNRDNSLSSLKSPESNIENEIQAFDRVPEEKPNYPNDDSNRIYKLLTEKYLHANNSSRESHTSPPVKLSRNKSPDENPSLGLSRNETSSSLTNVDCARCSNLLNILQERKDANNQLEKENHLNKITIQSLKDRLLRVLGSIASDLEEKNISSEFIEEKELSKMSSDLAGLDKECSEIFLEIKFKIRERNDELRRYQQIASALIKRQENSRNLNDRKENLLSGIIVSNASAEPLNDLLASRYNEVLTHEEAGSQKKAQVKVDDSKSVQNSREHKSDVITVQNSTKESSIDTKNQEVSLDISTLKLKDSEKMAHTAENSAQGVNETNSAVKKHGTLQQVGEKLQQLEKQQQQQVDSAEIELKNSRNNETSFKNTIAQDETQEDIQDDINVGQHVPEQNHRELSSTEPKRSTGSQKYKSSPATSKKRSSNTILSTLDLHVVQETSKTPLKDSSIKQGEITRKSVTNTELKPETRAILQRAKSHKSNSVVGISKLPEEQLIAATETESRTQIKRQAKSSERKRPEPSVFNSTPLKKENLSNSFEDGMKNNSQLNLSQEIDAYQPQNISANLYGTPLRNPQKNLKVSKAIQKEQPRVNLSGKTEKATANKEREFLGKEALFRKNPSSPVKKGPIAFKDTSKKKETLLKKQAPNKIEPLGKDVQNTDASIKPANITKQDHIKDSIKAEADFKITKCMPDEQKEIIEDAQVLGTPKKADLSTKKGVESIGSPQNQGNTPNSGENLESELHKFSPDRTFENLRDTTETPGGQKKRVPFKVSYNLAQLDHGEEIAFIDSGPSSAKYALIVIHGEVSTSAIFIDLMARIRDNIRVIAIDLRGHGKSSFNKPFLSVDELAEDVAEVVDILGLTRVSLIGYSLGGGVCLSYATRYPEMIEKIILLNSIGLHGLGTSTKPKTFDHLQKDEDIVNIKTHLASEDLDYFAARLARYSKIMSPGIFTTFCKEISGLKAFQDSLYVLGTTDLTDLVGKIKCNILLIHGRESDYCSVEVSKETKKALGYLAKLEIWEGCGNHIVTFDPRKLQDSVLGFLFDEESDYVSD